MSSIEQSNPELFELLEAIKPIIQENKHLQGVVSQLNARVGVLMQMTQVLQEACHQLAVAGGLVADDSIPFAVRETADGGIGIEEERRLVWDLLKKLREKPGGDKKASEIIKEHCPRMEGKALDKIRAMTDENKLFDMRKAINQAML